MKKRQKFECWHCQKNFSIFREFTEEQTLTVFCPFCAVECVVELEPHHIVKVLRGETGPQAEGVELNLPDVLQTRKK